VYGKIGKNQYRRGFDMVSESKRLANRRWDAANLDKVNFGFPRGTKAALDAIAEQTGVSRAAFILQAVKEKCQRDGLDITWPG
jgi:hypothetical protein